MAFHMVTGSESMCLFFYPSKYGTLVNFTCQLIPNKVNDVNCSRLLNLVVLKEGEKFHRFVPL